MIGLESRNNGQVHQIHMDTINTQLYHSFNATAGFSIVKYTGNAANAGVGHGLGVAPKMIISKRIKVVHMIGLWWI